MEIKIYDSLPEDARTIRIKVFVEEQGFKEEFDSVDDSATHIVAYDGATPVATCRFFIKDGSYLLGRIAVLKEYRGKHVGAFIMQEAQAQIAALGGKRILIHAQRQARDFYVKQGYTDSGKTDYEEGCPHVWLYKDI